MTSGPRSGDHDGRRPRHPHLILIERRVLAEPIVVETEPAVWVGVEPVEEPVEVEVGSSSAVALAETAPLEVVLPEPSVAETPVV